MRIMLGNDHLLKM